MDTRILTVSSFDGNCTKFLILLQSQKNGSVLAINWKEQSVYAAIFTNEGVYRERNNNMANRIFKPNIYFKLYFFVNSPQILLIDSAIGV